MSDKSHILVIDDEKNYLLVLQTLLEDEGYTVTAISDPETALAFLAESEVDVVVTDMKMPKVSGREVLQHVKKSWPYIPVLIMTAFGSIESAVEAMKYGAFDYITKPFSNDELLLSIHNATELARAHRQYRLLQEAMEERYSVHQIVGRSRAQPLHGAHHRRVGHGQGTGGPRHPLRQPAQGKALRLGQLHGPQPRGAGERALRP